MLQKNKNKQNKNKTKLVEEESIVISKLKLITCNNQQATPITEEI